MFLLLSNSSIMIKIVLGSCTTEHGQQLCKEANGICHIQRDGYYSVGITCVVLGLVLLLAYIKPVTERLEKLPRRMWRLN